MLVKSKRPNGHFRAGRHFSREAVKIDKSILEKSHIQAIKNDPDLIIEDDSASATLSNDDLLTRIKEALPQVSKEDCNQDGKPKLIPLREKMIEIAHQYGINPALIPSKIEKEKRDDAFASLERGCGG